MSVPGMSTEPWLSFCRTIPVSIKKTDIKTNGIHASEMLPSVSFFVSFSEDCLDAPPIIAMASAACGSRGSRAMDGVAAGGVSVMAAEVGASAVMAGGLSGAGEGVRLAGSGDRRLRRRREVPFLLRLPELQEDPRHPQREDAAADVGHRI